MPQSKSELLKKVTIARDQLDALLGEIDPALMEIGGVEGEWSIKDLIAHVNIWEERMVGWMELTLRGENPMQLPEGETWDDLDAWNHRTYLEMKPIPLDEVIQTWKANFARVISAIDSASEEDLLEADRFTWREGKALWLMIASNTYVHYQDHQETIETWLRSRE